MSTPAAGTDELPQLREGLAHVRGEVERLNARLVELETVAERVATWMQAPTQPIGALQKLPPLVPLELAPKSITEVAAAISASILPTIAPATSAQIAPISIASNLVDHNTTPANTISAAQSIKQSQAFDLFPNVEWKPEPAANDSANQCSADREELTLAPLVEPVRAAPLNAAWATKQNPKSPVVNIEPIAANRTTTTPRPVEPKYSDNPAIERAVERMDEIASGIGKFVAGFAKPKEIDWEGVIGGRWMTWVGAFTLLLAVGFGIHWAWTTLQTPPWVHVAAFHLLGAGFLGTAYVSSRRGAPLAGKALLGLGIFTLYAAAYAAQHLYNLWPQSTAFCECAAITALAIGLALRADSASVVLLGALGGYLTPILTSCGSGNYIGLFTYLAFLNTALVACTVLRHWSFLKPLTLIATAAMFAAWVTSSHFDAHSNSMVQGTESFAALHALIFLIGSTAPPVAWKRASRATDLFTLAANSLLFVGFTWALFHDRPDQQLAIFSWGMAALHGVLFWLTYSRVTNVDRMPRIHLALAALFFTLAIPLQLDDPAYWGATWCLEAFAFTAVGVYFRDRQMCTSAAIVLLLAAGRLLGWDWHAAPRLVHGTEIDLRFMMFFIGGFIAMLCGGLYRFIPWVFNRPAASDGDREFKRQTAGMLAAVGAALFTMAPMLQLTDWVYLGPLWVAEAFCFTLLGLLLRDFQMRMTGFIVLLLAGARLVGFDFLSTAHSIGHSIYDARFVAYLCSAVGAPECGALYRLIPQMLRRKAVSTEADRSASVLISAVGAVLLTMAPMLQLTEWAYLGPIWAAEAFCFTLAGLLLRNFQMRVTGFIVLLIAGLRLVAFDFFSPAQAIGQSNIDLRFIALLASGLVALLCGGLYRFAPWILRRESLKSETDRSAAGLIAAVGTVLVTLSPMLQLTDWIYLGPIWAIEALLFTLLGLAIRDLQMRITAVAIFLLAAGRLIGFDCVSPARTFARTALDVRSVAFLFAGTLALGCGALYRVLHWRRNITTGLRESAKIFSGDATQITLQDFALALPNLLSVLGALLVTFSPPLQLADWSMLAPVWAIEALAFTCVGLLFGDRLLAMVGLAVFSAAAVALVPYDYRSSPKLIAGTAWDLRFVVMEASGLLAIGAGALYWVVPKFLRRKPAIDAFDQQLGGVLLAAGNLALMIGLTCQWDTRFVLAAWTLNAFLILSAGFYFDLAVVRWYAIALALLMVASRAVFDGDKLDGAYHLIANSRFGALALVAAFYFYIGGMFRRRKAKRLAAGKQPHLVEPGKFASGDETLLDPVFGILANVALFAAVSMEIHSWFKTAIAAGQLPFPDMHMAEMAAYSIVWAIYTAVMVAIGFALQYKLFRVIGLVAFGPILLKVFFVDLEHLQLLPRALAFAVLGVMLLGVSMLYQKFAVGVSKSSP